MTRMQKWILVITIVVWIMVLCSCVSSWTNTRDRNRNTPTTGVKPAQQQKIITTIPVDQIDIDGDGQISQSEQQQLTTHDNHALLTFLCISGATIIMCVGGAWVTCRHRARSDTSAKPAYGPDRPGSADGDLRPEAIDTSDGGDWLDSEQDFSGDTRKP